MTSSDNTGGIDINQKTRSYIALGMCGKITRIETLQTPDRVHYPFSTFVLRHYIGLHIQNSYTSHHMSQPYFEIM